MIALRTLVGAAVLVLIGVAAKPIFAADQFVLEVPGDPTTRSAATVSVREITVVDATGNRHLYVRRRDQDSADGRYFAYFSERANRFLRWPVAGEGAMFLGTVEFGAVNWTRSRMVVRPLPDVGGAGGLVIGGRPVPGGLAAIPPGAELMHVAALPGPDGNVAAHVDREGQLHFFVERDGRWRHENTDARLRLPAGAPLVLVDEPRAALPTIYSVDERGRLIEIYAGQRLREVPLRDPLLFAHHSSLAVLRRDRETRLLGVDSRGRLFDLDPATGVVEFVEERAGLLEPGVPLIALTGDTADHLFLIDRRGHLLGYARSARRWSRPFQVARDLAAGGELCGAYTAVGGGRGISLTIGSVDVRGRLHLWRELGGAWDDEIVDAGRFVAGGTVAMINRRGELLLTTITADGRWTELRHTVGGWDKQLIASGFPAGGNSVLLAGGPSAFAVDRTGRLVSARYLRDAWECSLCLPGRNFAPRLVRRTIEPGEPLPPANIDFENRHTEELVVRIQNTANPDVPIEFAIPPGKSVAQKLERISGSMLEEVYLVPGPDGALVEEVHRHPLPARTMYNVVVYANRVTSVYFDRTKNKSDVPDEANTSLVSLGVFTLPPGELLRDGERVDVYRQAIARRNPGAAALADPQRP